MTGVIHSVFSAPESPHALQRGSKVYKIRLISAACLAINVLSIYICTPFLAGFIVPAWVDTLKSLKSYS